MSATLSEDRRRLAEDNVRLAYALALKHRSRRPLLARLPVEEVKAAALYALVKAARRFDPSRGLRFSTYAGAAIKNELLRLCRHAGVVTLPARLAACPSPAGEDSGVARVLGASSIDHSRRSQELAPDRLADDPCEAAARSEAADVLARVMARLHGREREVLLMRYRDGLTLRQIAAALGLSGERARQVVADALAHARHVTCHLGMKAMA